MTGRRFKTAYLHIGGEKTGSTALQQFLGRNRGRLLAEGFVFPVTPGDRNHIEIAKYAQTDCANANFLANLEIADEAALARFHRRFRANLLAELAATSAEADILILSSEHCQSEVHREADVRHLADLLHEVADTVRIVFYVRRQDRVAVSMFSTLLKVGFVRALPELAAVRDDPRYAHSRVAGLYESVFGAGALEVRLHSQARLSPGGLIGDFQRTIGLASQRTWKMPEHQNRSLNRAAQTLLYTVNQWPGGPFHPKGGNFRRTLIRALEQKCEGDGILPPRRAAQAFVHQFAKENEVLRRRYFKDLPGPLFGDDYSAYPETRSGLAVISPDEVVTFLENTFPGRTQLLKAARAYAASLKA